jgi:purine-binding chemotaxis protein CheW
MEVGDMAVQVTEDEELVAEEIEADQYLVFTAQAQECGFQAMRVQEISQVLPVTQVPNAPPYIEGIMNLRGRIASVINFRKKFGYAPKAHDEDTRVIVVELDDYPVGIIVDSVEEVVKIPDSAVQNLPESMSSTEAKEYITGIGMLDKRLILLLDLDNVLTGVEPIDVNKLNQTINKVRAVEKTESKIIQSGTGQSSSQLTDKIETVKMVEKLKTEKQDTKPPVDTGKRQPKRREG